MSAVDTSTVSSLGALSAATLPPLREDLEILAGDKSGSGKLGWVIYDPLQHRYFKIDNATKGLLSLWRAGMTSAELSRNASIRLGLTIDVGQVTGLIAFLRANNLTINSDADAWREVAARAKLGRHSMIAQLIHGYLFFKVPLVRPQRVLEAALPQVEMFFRWQTAAAVGLAGLIGAYLVSRQWDTFIHTFQGFFTLEGALWFGLCLIFVKAMHELGHAFTAVRFGCRIPTMGIAFMVMMPLLYTDVTDAWRLRSRRQRLLIDAAGVLVELALACVATFTWAFVPDGPVRGAMFMVATAGWVLSLGINLNPFMRFDGYFLLADLIGVENLQPRAFALGRWKLRQILFAPSLEPPEFLPVRKCIGLILYAWCTWLYRLVVFTGIAIVVYHFSFKALGIVLFFIEIWFFIARPIITEIIAWRKIEPDAHSSLRAMVTAAGLLIMCLFVFVPWSTHIEVPAVLSAADLTQIYPVRPAKVVSVEGKYGHKVSAGATIAKLVAPDIDKEISKTKIDINLIKLRLGRAMADEAEREQYLVLTNQLASLQSKLEGLLKEKDELIVRSPITGTILELGPNLHSGRWLGKADLITLVSSHKKYVVRGYIAETELSRVKPAALGRFVPDDLMRPTISVKLVGVARAGATQIDIQELASIYGGRIPVESDSKQRLAPVTAQYLVELEPQDFNGSPDQIVRGVVELQGKSTSILTRVMGNVLKVLIRESGF